MKKISLFVAIVLSFSLLAACGKTETPPPTSSSEKQSSSVASETTESASVSSAPESLSQDERELGNIQNPDTPIRGVWNGNVYQNDFASFTFTAPEEWLILSDQELAAIVNMGVDFIAEEGAAFDEKALEQQVLAEMGVFNQSNSSNMNILYENLNLHPLGRLVSEELYLEATKTQLESMGTITYKSIETSKQVLGNAEYTMLKTSAEIEGKAFSQYIGVRKIGGFMVVITITLNAPDTIDSFIGCFS